MGEDTDARGPRPPGAGAGPANRGGCAYLDRVRVRHLLAAVALSALFHAGLAARAGESTDAASVTQAGRGLDKALDQVLTLPLAEGRPVTSVLFLVDVTRALKEAAFGERLSQALQRHGKALQGVEVGLARAGAKGLVTVPPGSDRVALLADLDAALSAASGNPVRNLYADARAAAQALSGEGRRLVLVSLDNGDAEDDVEATVKALVRSRVSCCVIAREAWLADSYAWSHPSQVSAPKGTVLAGGDGAWPEVPWGWVLQQYNGHEVAPSGYAPYGLARLAAGTGGRVFLYSASGGRHECAAQGICTFCEQDHLPAHEGYLPHRVKTLAPSLAPRDEVLAEDARDPWLRLVLDLWEKAAKEGLIRSRPPVSVAGGGLKLEHRAVNVPSTLSQSGLAFGRLAKEAARLREAGDRLLAAYQDDLAKIAPDAGSPRHRATADLVRVQLHLTLVNLGLLEGWCLGAGPAEVGRTEHVPEPPEVARYAQDQRVVGWTYSTNCLCHGLAPYRQQRLSGGGDLGQRFDALEAVLATYFQRYDHTPYGAAARRTGLTVFIPTIQGKLLPLPPRKGGSTEAEGGATTDRPGRSGGGSGESGPATTGK